MAIIFSYISYNECRSEFPDSTSSQEMAMVVVYMIAVTNLKCDYNSFTAVVFEWFIKKNKTGGVMKSIRSIHCYQLKLFNSMWASGVSNHQLSSCYEFDVVPLTELVSWI